MIIMLKFSMNKILQFIVPILFLFTFTTNLTAGFLPDKIYKSIENRVKENVGMEKPNYDEFIVEEKEHIKPQVREEYIKKQFLKKEDIAENDVLIKEEISIEMEATQFFDSLNQEHTKPVDME